MSPFSFTEKYETFWSTQVANFLTVEVIFHVVLVGIILFFISYKLSQKSIYPIYYPSNRLSVGTQTFPRFDDIPVNKFIETLEMYYLGSDEEKRPGPTTMSKRRESVPSASATPISITPLPTEGFPNQYIIDKLNSIESKIDSLISRVSAVEHKAQVTNDSILDLRRALPRYATTPVASAPATERHFL